MTTANFLNLLNENSSKELIFEYQNSAYVPKAYHITEIKNVNIESVDCGGYAHDEQQTVVQLWIDGVETAERFMSAEKANKIFTIVDKVKPLNREAEIFFEWGMAGLPTSTYRIDQIDNQADSVTVKMSVPPTVCRPKLMPLETVNTSNKVCNPGSGCC